MPAAAPAQTANTQSFNTAATAAAQAIEQEQQKGGGGGGGHGHAVKKPLDSIDDIAARASLNIEQRKKTMLDRMRDIERMKTEMAAEDQAVGEKEGGSGEQDESPEDEPKPEQ
jgi:hypothetical protein